MHNLSTRQQSLLNRIIEIHIETAQPVGSQTLTDVYTGLYRSFYSPATVRAEMGQLEDMGYLTHPHTSAGRVPTDLGYRYYVDHGLKEENPSEDVLSRMDEELSQASEEAETFAEYASRILSQLTGEVSLIVISDSKRRYRLFFQGSSCMLEKPEFQDVSRVHPILKSLEKTGLAEWLFSRTPKEGVSVTIGQENESDAFRGCSIVTTRSGNEKNHHGAVGVLGPSRMKYSKTLPLVAQMAKRMKRVLENVSR